MKLVPLVLLASVPLASCVTPDTAPGPGAEPGLLATVTQWSPHPGPPPIGRFFGPDAALQFMHKGNITGEARFGARIPGVKIAWDLKVGSAYLLQKIPTSYWPTWVLTSADGQYLYIGGKRRSNGNTVIERLLVGSPIEVLDVSTPTKTIILPAPITEIVTMYDEATEGRDYVSALLEKRARSDTLLVHFDDSGDVYELEWDEESMAAALSLVASPNASGPSVVTAPGLTQSSPFAWTAEHSTLGYVYVFTRAPNTGPNDPVVLFDDDLDGHLDGGLTLDTPGWVANGLHDSANFVTLDK